jgi:putative MATE family efflux protein
MVGVGLMLFLAVGAGAVVKATGLQGDARTFALSYLRMLSPSAPFLICMFVANACLRGAGDTLTPAVSMIIVDIVNIIFSWGFTWGWFGLPALGFNGIAIGTVIAYIVGGVIQIIVLLVGRGGIKLHVHRLRPNWFDMKRILRIGLPNAGESMINWAANFFLLNIVNRTVPVNVAAAAHTNAIRIESISYMAGFAIAVAATTMVGQSLGMKDHRRATRSAYLAYAIGGGFMTFIGLLFIFFSRYPASVLSGEPAVRDLTAKCLQITGFCQSGFGAFIIFSGALRGAGDTLWVMMLSMTSIITRVGGVAIVGGLLHQSLPVIWIVLASDLFFRGVLMWARFATGKWKHIQV